MATPADLRDPYLADFAKLEGTTFSSDPGWLRDLRKAAIASFSDQGFPTIKHPDWKYTNVAPIARTRFALADGRGGGLTRRDLGPVSFEGLQAIQLVFINGRLSKRLSSVPGVPSGVRVGSLAEALERDPDALEPHLGKYAGPSDGTFTALNTAFFRDGAFVEVPKGAAVENPIHLLFLTAPPDGSIVTYPRSLILLGEQSRATVIENYAGLGSRTYLTNAVTEVDVGDGAALDHYKVQREAGTGFHVGSVEIEQAGNTNVTDHTISMGGALVRNNANASFTAEGGELAMNGLFVVGGQQHVDNHTRIDHLKPRCTSRELYKGILDDRARGIFYGIIMVHKDAQKTNALQTNKNLLLSREALVDSIPGLQILANDVKCKHGSTTGQLDENAIFYLRSRGIDPDTARGVLTYAFARELVNAIRVPAVKARLDDLILDRIPNRERVREAL